MKQDINKILGAREQDLRWLVEGENVLNWERQAEAIDGVQRILPHDSRAFCEALLHDSDIDSYLTSPIYYFFTGRKGLWIYKEGDTFVPFCWHPNVSDQILIFPERGAATNSVLPALLKKLPVPAAGLRLARVKSGYDAPACGTISTPNRSVSLSPVVEQVLDWKYPIRVLSTETLSKMEGPAYRYIRNHVRHIETAGASVVSLQDVNPVEVDAFINNWSSAATNISTETAELVRLYRYILSLSQMPFVRLKGFVVLVQGEIEALTMWDVSNPDDPTGNRFVNLCNTSYRGMADFSTRSLANKLLSDGVQYLNIGGAETVNLDQFKRKFVPAFSIRLESIDVDIDTPLHQEASSGAKNFRGIA
ncbi:MAG: phosphatidylglycerol lysyltransferase domain-containing protein [Alphaproteobacteria bacterium]|nr:phosphatidylglycerol lysyltransferase domain-containing protein [Alphaproteobacteria bacterium]